MTMVRTFQLPGLLLSLALVQDLTLEEPPKLIKLHI